MINCLHGGCLACRERNEVFNSLSADELSVIDSCRTNIRYRPGEVIFKQGTPCYNFYCITSGLVKLFIENSNHHNLIIDLVTPVEYIYIPGIFNDQKHHFSAAACEETTACLIDIHVMTDMMKKNPDFAMEFIKKISKQSVGMLEKMSGYNHKQVFGRVAETLFFLSKDIYKKNPFTLSLSRQELADMTGITKESFIRVLKKFKEDGIITMEGNHCEILNFQMLERISVKG